MSQVYFIKSGDRIKIGFSTNVPERMDALGAGCPGQLELLGTVPGGKALEQAIHRHLKDHRSHREWFYDNEPVQAAIVALLLDGPSAIGFVQPPSKVEPPPPRTPPTVDFSPRNIAPNWRSALANQICAVSARYDARLSVLSPRARSDGYTILISASEAALDALELSEAEYPTPEEACIAANAEADLLRLIATHEIQTQSA